MKNRFDRLETQLENLVERLFGGKLDARAVLRSVERSFEEALIETPEERPVAPTQLQITLHPDDLKVLLIEQPDLELQLEYYVIELAKQHDAVLATDPVITLKDDRAQEPYTLAIKFSHAPIVKHGTERMPPAKSTQPKVYPRHAQLVREGQVLMELDRQVINIGRHRDNHLVLDDARISRWHCQLRMRHGRFAIYDLNSMHGTFVNGNKIVEHILQSGDVVALGSISLIYMDDERTDDLGEKRDTQIKPPVQ
jgi:hypothetical protein